MLRTIILVSSGGIVGALFVAAAMRFSVIGNILNTIKAIIEGIVSRVDRLLTGNDGNYSHTRLLNIIWGIGSLALVYIAVLRNIKIPDGILFLMGASTGVNMAGTVLNKIQEIKGANNGQ